MIQLISVSLGKKRVALPVCIIKGKNPGKKILITGGIDGDEYASIDACYKLITELNPKKINGIITIIPIANINGFEALRSYNPEDSKYPKEIYPGKKNGTSSEQLLYFLDQNYISRSDIWIDLHGGSLTEQLKPYAYFYKTKDEALNKTIESIISHIVLEKVVYRDAKAWKKTNELAKRRIIYILIESGTSSNRDSKWIDTHIRSVNCILGVTGVTKEIGSVIKKRIYTKTSFYMSKKKGLWFSNFPANGYVKKGDILGELKSLHQIRLGAVKAEEEGEVLWYTEGLSVKKGDILCEIAFEEKN